MKQLFSLQKIIVSLVFIFLSFNCFAGDPFCLKGGAREAGMGGVCLFGNDIWSCFNNQAGLSTNQSLIFGFNYENRFGLKELGTRSAGLLVPAGRASFGAVFSDFGYSDFRRELLGIACGMPLSKIISGGVQIDYMAEKTIREYNDLRFLTCEAGIILTPNENLKAGIHLFNPVPNSVRKTGLQSELKTEVAVRLSSDLFLAAELKMKMGQIIAIRTGFEYDAYRKFDIRGGFSSENNSFCFGIGYEAGPARIDIGFTTHERLGVTSSISIIFDLKSSNRKEHKDLRQEH